MTTTPPEFPWNPDAADQLRAYLNRPGYTIPVGPGTRANACSIGAINLVLRDCLDDTPPDCMSEVIGHWVRNVQDLMPGTLRNSAQWKSALVQSAGTGREPALEDARLDALVDWLYDTVLPAAEQAAHTRGFGTQFKLMCNSKSLEHADQLVETTSTLFGVEHPAHQVAYRMFNIARRGYFGHMGHGMAIAKVAAEAANFITHDEGETSEPENLLQIQRECQVWQRFNPAAALSRVSQIALQVNQ